MSITGALLELSARADVGEWLMVEVDCPTGNGSINVFRRCAVIVRNRRAPSTVVAVAFAPVRPQPIALAEEPALFGESDQRG